MPQECFGDSSDFGSFGTPVYTGCQFNSSSTYLGKTITKATFNIRTSNNSTDADIFAYIIDSSFTTKATSTNSINNQSLNQATTGTVFTSFQFTFSGYTLADGDVICVQAPISYLQTGQEPGAGDENTEALIESNAGGTAWGSITGAIPYFCITYSTSPVSTGTRLPPPPLIARF